MPVRRVPTWWRDASTAVFWGVLLFVTALWLGAGGVQGLSSLPGGLTSLGRLTGLIASALLLVQVFLMARVPWFEQAWGQDQLARTHRIVGFTSFTLLWVHVVLITLGYAAASPALLWGTIVDFTLNYPGMLLAIAGTAALAGTTVAALVAGGGAVLALAVWLIRARRSAGAAPAPDFTDSASWPAPAGPALSPSPIRPATAPSAGRADTVATGGARLLPPVSALTTRALGREWLRTTTALAGRLDPAARESIVRRREDALDELERRDPVGFARWIAEGPQPGSDPADYLRPEAA